MTGRLLDTNAVIAYFARDVSLRQLIVSLTDVFVPGVALGELYYGAYKSQQVQANLVRVKTFAAARQILHGDSATAHEYGRVKNLLRAKGRPIPDNDLWIAALALQRGLILVTRDQHFDEVDGLQIEKW